MHTLREVLWVVLLCAGCGAVDAHDPAPTAPPDSSPETGDAALDRLVSRCGASCPPDQQLVLAQHLIERAQAARLRALASGERVHAERDPAAQQEARAVAEGANREAVRDRQRAIELLRAISEDATVPPTRAVETALFELLFALGQESARDDVQLIAQRIVRDAPTRPAAAHGWLAIADRAFEDAELERARDGYLAAAAVPGADTHVVVYSTYKLGWTYFNLGDFRAACAAFRAVSAADTQPLIAREARRDFVRALIPLDGSAAQDVAEVRGVAPDDAQATELARRYEEALRDVGHEARADAFRAAWR